MVTEEALGGVAYKKSWCQFQDQKLKVKVGMVSCVAEGAALSPALLARRRPFSLCLFKKHPHQGYAVSLILESKGGRERHIRMREQQQSVVFPTHLNQPGMEPAAVVLP